MRGSLKKRYPGSWSIILDVGTTRDPVTGATKRKQKWITFRGTKKQAQAQLAKLLTDLNRGVFVEPTQITVAAWLDEWLEKAIKPPRRTAGAYATYRITSS